jgi:predicted NBD/HSP70 family sugar kinase
MSALFRSSHDAHYVAIDIGGTNTRVALFPSLDAPEHTLLAQFPTFPSYDEQQRRIAELLPRDTSYAGIGVSIGGRIARDGRGVVVAPNMPDYIGKPFAHDIERVFDCPVRLAHDTVCGLLAEKRFGCLRNDERCAYLTVSTGTGAAIHLEKAGSGLTSSIEIGHQLLDGNEYVCLCGQVGCLETYTGGRQVELRLGQPLSAVTDAAIWRTFYRKLALGLVNLAQLTRVDVIAVSGAIALHNAHVIPSVQADVNELLRGATLELRLARLGESAPLVGAARLLATPEEKLLH